MSERVEVVELVSIGGGGTARVLRHVDVTFGFPFDSKRYKIHHRGLQYWIWDTSKWMKPPWDMMHPAICMEGSMLSALEYIAHLRLMHAKGKLE